LNCLPLGYDARNTLTLIAVRLSGATAVLRLLATPRNIAGGLHEFLPTTFPLLQTNGRAKFLVNEKLRARNANTTQDIENHREKLNVVYRATKSIVTKVSRTVIVRLTT
jgi:hypothetical protein